MTEEATQQTGLLSKLLESKVLIGLSKYLTFIFLIVMIILFLLGVVTSNTCGGNQSTAILLLFPFTFGLFPVLICLCFLKIIQSLDELKAHLIQPTEIPDTDSQEE